MRLLNTPAVDSVSAAGSVLCVYCMLIIRVSRSKTQVCQPLSPVCLRLPTLNRNHVALPPPLLKVHKHEIILNFVLI
jgi:hypothetical protein